MLSWLGMRGGISAFSTRALGFTLALLLAFPAAAQVGRVVRIHDGDTVTIDVGERIVVRLQDIDAPESGQDFGQSSRAELERLCPVGSTAELFKKEPDKYGRWVGRLLCGSRDASEAQVRSGLAWVFVRYAPKNSGLYELEREAKLSRRGLWQTADPMPPWEWRTRKR